MLMLMFRVKLYGKYTNIDIVAGLLWEEDRDEYRDELLNILLICRYLVELGGVTAFARTGLLQALAGNVLCEPQSVKLAQLLIDRGADVNELPPKDLRYYKMDDEDYADFKVATALQKATQANHQAMVELLLARSAIAVELSSSGKSPRST
jgi:ankyrin repeat protein